LSQEKVVPLPRRILDAVTRLTGRAPNVPAPAQEPVEPLQSQFGPMRIHLVCYEEVDAWILGKIARRLYRELEAFGMNVTLGQSADASAEINHHIVYFDYEDRAPTLETVMITHINDERELGKVRRQLVDCNVDMGICMSFEAVHRLAHFGIPRQKLCFIGPAHDGVLRPRRTVVGLTTRLYPDGCKREQLLAELGETISPDHFAFAIMGSGWDAVVARLRELGFEVRFIDHFDETLYRELIPALDYYLYLGQDEGSMGFLDALAAGVPTIVTPQGFHLDVPGGIAYPVVTIQDLRRVFTEIADQKNQRAKSVASLTWAENARKHLLVWQYLLNKKAGRVVSAHARNELERLAMLPGLYSHESHAEAPSTQAQ
jgi:hypothetical protein